MIACGDAVGVDTQNRPVENARSCPGGVGTAVVRIPATSGFGRQLGLLLAITLLIGLPLRMLVVSRAAMVSRDTVTFIWYAQALADDPLAAMRGHDQHPLYPALVLAAHETAERLPLLPASVRNDPIRSWTTAAVSVTMLGGLAVIIAVYLLTSRLFDRQTGLLAAVLAAVAAEFCQLSADGLTDMPHLAIYLLAIWSGIRGFQEQRYRWFALAGLLGGINYLLRPEGAEPAVVIAGLLAVPYACRLAWRRRLLAMVCVIAASVVAAAPYMLATGKLVQKKSIWRFFESGEPAPAALLDADTLLAGDMPENANIRGEGFARAGIATDAPKAIMLVGEDWVRSLRVTYLFPILIWLALQRGLPADRTGLRIVEAAAGLHLLVLMALIVQFDYWDLFSLRHVMVLTGLSIPFVAAGVVALIESLPEQRQGWATMLLAVGLIAPTLPWLFEARHREDAHFVRASQWIHENTPHRPRVLTERYRMAFYARGDYIPAPLTADAPDYLARARQSRPDWVVFDERRILKESPGFFEALQQSIVPGETLELARIEKNKTPRGQRQVLIYRYRYEPRN